MNTRIMAVALAVVSLIGARAALALQGELPNGPDYQSKTLVVISNVIATETVCGFARELYNVVVIDGSGEPAIVTTLAVPVGTNLSPGDRFLLDTPSPCAGTHEQVQLLPKTPPHVDVRASEERNEEAGGRASTCISPTSSGDRPITETRGTIFKKQGSPAQQVDITTDDVLLAADVLRDLIALGQDPDTGEHLYLAEIEW